MATAWTPDDLRAITVADELEVSAERRDGKPRRWVPIWVVCVDDEVFVRTWQRRTTGWFGQVLDSGRAAVRVPGLVADVVVEDVGAELRRAEVDAAYDTKYGRYGASVGRMVGDDAAATTLRLVRS